ncbi:MAG TPA: TrbI/VirB10 family protein, partial [Thermoanaerobaculia bacterium]|nr:TrbI/VirB10 family protein [Thermoanaerobaculia bacterium]
MTDLGDSTAPAPDLKPAIVRVERLNPLPLAIAAVVLGGTLIVAALVVSRRSATAPVPPPPAPVNTEPGFLARPPEPAHASAAPAPTQEEILAALEAQRSTWGPPATEPTSAPDEYDRYPEATSPAPPPAPRDPGREAFDRALRSPLSVEPPTAAPAPPSHGGLLDEMGIPHDSTVMQPPSLRDLVEASFPAKPGGGGEASALPGASASAGSSPALREAPREVLAHFDPAAGAGRTRVRAGTLIPALLATGVNSDLPGDVLAQVERNVYDEAQRRVLIPRGARLLGRYENQVALGQNRLLVAW